jgi:hypothetical protein
MGYIPLVQRVKFPACSGRSITHSDRASFLMPFCDDDSHLICLVFLSRNRFYIFSLKAHVIFPTPATVVTPTKGRPWFETSNFSLYCSGSCNHTNESLLLLALPTLAQTAQDKIIE